MYCRAEEIVSSAKRASSLSSRRSPKLLVGLLHVISGGVIWADPISNPMIRSGTAGESTRRFSLNSNKNTSLLRGITFQSLIWKGKAIWLSFQSHPPQDPLELGYHFKWEVPIKQVNNNIRKQTIVTFSQNIIHIEGLALESSGPQLNMT